MAPVQLATSDPRPGPIFYRDGNALAPSQLCPSTELLQLIREFMRQAKRWEQFQCQVGLFVVVETGAAGQAPTHRHPVSANRAARRRARDVASQRQAPAWGNFESHGGTLTSRCLTT